MELLLVAILVALAFEYINGFHDTANSIATVVATKVLTPTQAVAMAAVTNLLGALVGTAVATTIGKGLVDTNFVTTGTVICGLMGGIFWNLLTWWLGLPSSSSHAMIGGLCGSTLAAAHGDWSVLKWSYINQAKGTWEGLLHKVVIPMVSSPIVGFVGGFLVMGVLYYLLRNWRPRTVNRVFGPLQLCSSAYMGFSHGTNDAQKTMGIIALALFSATQAGELNNVPHYLEFLRTPTFEIAIWVKIACAITMAAGTAAGGWRIIKTLGHRMVRLKPVHGFAAETTSATVIMLAAKLGMPISTTHAITTSIMGVGAAKSFRALRWGIVERILWAWVLTIPVTAVLSYLFVRAAIVIGWMK